MIDDTTEIVLRLHLVIAGPHDDEVHPGRADLLIDGRLRAAADRDHREHRRDTNRDADHRERALQLVAGERLEGDAETGTDRHQCVSLAGNPFLPAKL